MPRVLSTLVFLLTSVYAAQHNDVGFANDASDRVTANCQQAVSLINLPRTCPLILPYIVL